MLFLLFFLFKSIIDFLLLSLLFLLILFVNLEKFYKTKDDKSKEKRKIIFTFSQISVFFSFSYEWKIVEHFLLKVTFDKCHICVSWKFVHRDFPHTKRNGGRRKNGKAWKYLYFVIWKVCCIFYIILIFLTLWLSKRNLCDINHKKQNIKKSMIFPYIIHMFMLFSTVSCSIFPFA